MYRKSNDIRDNGIGDIQVHLKNRRIRNRAKRSRFYGGST